MDRGPGGGLAAERRPLLLRADAARRGRRGRRGPRLGQLSHRRHGLAGDVRETQQFPPAALHLGAPYHEPHREASQKTVGSETGPVGPRSPPARAHPHIALRAESAWAIVTPSAYSRSPPTGSPRAIRVML